MKSIQYSLRDVSGYSSIMQHLGVFIPKEYQLMESDTPDYLICSCFGRDILEKDAIRIEYIGENFEPDFNIYDYAIGFQHIQHGDRYLRFPIYALTYRKAFLEALVKHKIKEEDIRNKSKFCSFVVSSGYDDDVRTHFFELLSNYKRVESGGRFRNNIGYSLKGQDGKKEFQQQCRFAIAFENSSTPGYTTEKLLQAWQAGTIPIYWGNPEIGKEFNTKAFINCHEYDSFEDVIEKVKEIDNDEQKYIEIMRQPILYDGCMAEQYVDETLLTRFLDNIFSQPKEKAFRRASYYSRFAMNYEIQHRGSQPQNKLKKIIRRILK